MGLISVATEGWARMAAAVTAPMGVTDSTAATVFTLGLLLRLMLTVLGEWLDSQGLGYTDIDYVVFTEAAREVVEGHSPYDRATYRYTPILAWLLAPNVWMVSWGKHVFTAVDMAIGWVTWQVLMARGVSQATAALYVACFLGHPFSINISTRGNADSFVCLFVLLAVYFLVRRRVDAAAICYGLSVVTKIYPVIYALPLLLFMNEQYEPTDFIQDGVHASRAGACWSLAAGAVPAALVRTILAAVAWPLTAVHGLLPAWAAAWTTGPVLACVAWCRAFVTARRVGFGLIALTTFASITAACYALYGYTFWYETYAYHLTRTDNRHNFSPLFYDLYLRYDSPTRTASGLLTFLPQFGTLLVLGCWYAADLPFALFLQTWVFVTWNKVITVQYFHWYLALAPLVLPQSWLSRVRTDWRAAAVAAVLGITWLATELHWNYWAFHLELRGQSVFGQVWVAGLLFLAANVVILFAFIAAHRYSPVWQGGQLVLLREEGGGQGRTQGGSGDSMDGAGPPTMDRGGGNGVVGSAPIRRRGRAASKSA